MVCNGGTGLLGLFGLLMMSWGPLMSLSIVGCFPHQYAEQTIPAGDHASLLFGLSICSPPLPVMLPTEIQYPCPLFAVTADSRFCCA
jgi:hypothetical protein